MTTHHSTSFGPNLKSLMTWGRITVMRPESILAMPVAEAAEMTIAAVRSRLCSVRWCRETSLCVSGEEFWRLISTTIGDASIARAMEATGRPKQGDEDAWRKKVNGFALYRLLSAFEMSLWTNRCTFLWLGCLAVSALESGSLSHVRTLWGESAKHPSYRVDCVACIFSTNTASKRGATQQMCMKINTQNFNQFN